MIGKTFAHFKILERLGGGGMGIVYLAEDTRLKRTVALKFLPPHLSTDEEAKVRFMQEAQSASALNHANICSIYDIGETEAGSGESSGQTFIAMAHYEGQTLGKKLDSGPLSVSEATDILRQVADGLAAAHEKGIVHRDIKPANIFITDRGRAIILDFGLAKLTGSLDLTKSGSTLGTIYYMAPEQIRGETADNRSDVWSLGVVLYEMLAGHRPFAGDYEQAISYSILNSEPASISGISEGIVEIIQRCLMKDPAKRFQNCSVLLTALDQTKTKPVTALHTVHPAAPTSHSRRWLWLGGVVLVSAVLALILLILPQEPSVTRLGRSYPVATTGALEDSPAWSPSGDRLAFHSRAAGNSDVWMITLGSGAPINLTADWDGADGFPSWSPDGSQIAFLSDRGDGGIFVMQIPQGQVRRIAPRVNLSPPIWTRDGGAIYYTWLDTLVRVDLAEGTTTREALAGTTQLRLQPALSPDGRYLAYVDAIATGSETDRLWVRDMSSGDSFEVTPRQGAYRSPFWGSDGRSLFFVSNLGGLSDVWRLDLDGSRRPVGDPVAVTNGVGIRDVAMAPSGTAMAFTKGHRIGTWNLWKIPLLQDRLATWDDAEKLTDDLALAEWTDLSTDGRRLLFSSDRLGNQDLWLMDLQTRALTQLTSGVENDWAPRWSPDESEIAFYSDRNGNRDIFVLTQESGFIRQITEHPSEDLQPDWSADGNEIWYYSMRTGVTTIFSSPAGGGPATERVAGALPRWSPAGMLAYQGGVGLSVLRDGETLRVADRANCGPWTRDGQALLCVRDTDIHELSLDGSSRPLTDLSGRDGQIGTGYTISVASDFMVFAWEEEEADVWVMEIEQQ